MPRKTASKQKAGWPAFWLQRGLAARLLWPLSQLFNLLAQRRRAAIVPQRLPVPVVVVGGLTVGGAGKTPLTLWLADALRARGYRPGIISRGYGGTMSGEIEVTPDSLPQVVGDEPLLMRQRAGCPVFVGADRHATGLALLTTHPDVNLLLCDDGLQHYRLARDVELVVLDRRGFGNGWTLPAGPLREPPERLADVDALILNQVPQPRTAASAVFSMQLQGALFYKLGAPSVIATAADLAGQVLHAMAGIGEPQRFFDHLAGLGLEFIPHAFPDHHAYVADELDFGDGVILTTEKDAVKLRPTLPPAVTVWVLPVTAQVTGGLDQLIVEKLNGRAPA